MKKEEGGKEATDHKWGGGGFEKHGHISPRRSQSKGGGEDRRQSFVIPSLFFLGLYNSEAMVNTDKQTLPTRVFIDVRPRCTSLGVSPRQRNSRSYTWSSGEGPTAPQTSQSGGDQTAPQTSRVRKSPHGNKYPPSLSNRPRRE